PLARAISAGNVPDHGLLHIGLRDGRIDLSGSKPAVAPRGKVDGEMKRVDSLVRRAHDLLKEFEQLQQQVRPLSDRNSELLQNMQQPGFYRDSQRRAATFDEIHKLDQFLNLHQGLGKALSGLCDRLNRQPPKEIEKAALEDRVEQLGAELGQLRFVAGCKDVRELGD